jgi:hypothetical protein
MATVEWHIMGKCTWSINRNELFSSQYDTEYEYEYVPCKCDRLVYHGSILSGNIVCKCAADGKPYGEQWFSVVTWSDNKYSSECEPGGRQFCMVEEWCSEGTDSNDRNIVEPDGG